MLISIIIPVFNAESYIQPCLDSISNQSYQEWECILIDDGSSDNSLLILNDIQKKDKRFKVIHQSNSGAGIARNRGIEMAKGEYIIFVDSDDTIDKNYLELLSLHNEDVVFIDINNISENGDLRGVEGASDYQYLSKDEIIRRQMTGILPWGGWRKAAKTYILKKYNILFSNLHIGEEAQYSFKLLYHASSIGFILTPVYNHIIRSGSLSQSFNEDPWGGIVPLFKEDKNIYELLKKGHYLNSLNLLNLRALIICLKRLAMSYPFKEYKIKAKKRLKFYKNCLVEGEGIDYNQIDLKTKFIYKIQLLNTSLIFIYNNLIKIYKQNL